MFKRYSPKEFAELVGVSIKTLQRWDNRGKLNASRLLNGRPFYTDEHLKIIKGETNHERVEVQQ